MSYKKSIFCISPAVEVAYDLHLSAALMRSCVSDGRSEASLLRDAKEFRSKLQDDHNERWKDGFSLRKIMIDCLPAHNYCEVHDGKDFLLKCYHATVMPTRGTTERTGLRSIPMWNGRCNCHQF